MMEAMIDSAFLGLTMSIGSYLLFKWIQKKTGWMVGNPLLMASLCIGILLLFDIPYEAFAKGGDIIHWMLSPVTALLALGIYNQRKVLKQYFLPVLLGCLAGSITSIVSVLLLCHVFGIDQAVTASLLPKSCTTPIAVAIAESHGGLSAIAACAVLLAGLTGALGAPMFAKWMKIEDPVAQGLATGACSHALGTSKAREMGELQGAMSSIAIGVCGLISVLLTQILPV